MIALRPVRDGDAEIFYEQQADPEARRMSAFPGRDREAFLAHQAKIMDDPAVLMRTIESGGKVAGNVATFMRGRLREVCYWLGKDFWSQGIATEALALFLAEYKERPLYARVAKLNAASRRVAEKCGFRIVAEESFKSPLGDNVEEYLMELR